MNRLVLVRHGGSTATEDPAFYAYDDSAICLTTNGIRQALSTAGVVVEIEPRWAKPGNFALEVFVSQYARTQQTARIMLDEMGLRSMAPKIRPLINERDYGVVYDPRMDQQADFDGNGCESGRRARARVRGFLDEIADLMDRADVLAFSHFGAIRALIANLLDLSDEAMMQLPVPNGGAFLFQRSFDGEGRPVFRQAPLPEHVLAKTASLITPPPASRRRAH